MKRQFIYGGLLICLFMLAGCSPKQDAGNDIKVTNQKEMEPNNSITEAQPVKDRSSVKGFINEPLDQDWYQISVPEDTAYILRARLTGVIGLNIKIELFDQDQDLLIEVDHNKEGEGEIITNYGLNPGEYFIRVRELWLRSQEKKSNDSSHYVLQTNFLPVSEAVEFEPNNRGVQASPIMAGMDVSGYISPYNDEDWFKLELPRQDNYYMTVSLSGVEDVDTKISIYDPIEALITAKDSEKKGEAEIIPNLGIDTTKSFYYVVVAGGQWQSNEESPYTLRIDYIETEGHVEIEPNDRMVRATRLVENDTIRGFMETAKDVDWYSWKNTDSTASVLRLEAIGVNKVDLQISVYNQDETEIFKVNDTGEMETEVISNLGFLPNQAYYFKIQNNLSKSNSEEFYTLITQISRYYNDEEFEVNNLPENASFIIENRPVEGYIHPGGDVDIYRLNLQNYPKSQLEIKLKGILKVNTDLVLYDYAMNELARAAERRAEETERIELTVEQGVYYLKVMGQNASECNYRDKYRLLATVRPIF